jgi:allantoicase
MESLELPDLLSARVGGRALYANDEFFAPKSCLVDPEPAIFVAGKYTDRGKWMDGWETRRRRTPGHDWCVLQLGLRGRLHEVDVDTSFFVGNQPEQASLEACDHRGPATRQALERAQWMVVLPPSQLEPGKSNPFRLKGQGPYTHVRLNIFPDGGIARLRVRGEVTVDLDRLRKKKLIDLAAIENGGVVLGASDEHFGKKGHLVLPGRASSMAEGWETRRRRGPGHDWAVVRLGAPGRLEKVEIDTAHFKGNFPESAALEGCLAPGKGLAELPSAAWQEILPRTTLRAHTRHHFAKQLRARGPFSHVRLLIYPDGGVSRLRLHGRLAEA